MLNSAFCRRLVLALVGAAGIMGSAADSQVAPETTPPVNPPQKIEPKPRQTIGLVFEGGGALGLAIFSAIATARTTHLLATHAPAPVAFDAGFHQALIASAIFLLAATLFALRTTGTRGEPPALPVRVPEIPAAENANHRPGTPSGRSEHVS